eukprot:8505724-Lingulodinium_polyedra.AAC.1
MARRRGDGSRPQPCWVLLGCCLGAAWLLLGCCLGAASVLLGPNAARTQPERSPNAPRYLNCAELRG